VAGARRRHDRNERAGQRLGFHCAPAGRRDGLIQPLTRFRRRSADWRAAALRDFDRACDRCGSKPVFPFHGRMSAFASCGPTGVVAVVGDVFAKRRRLMHAWAEFCEARRQRTP
jgi:hypothetical protein